MGLLSNRIAGGDCESIVLKTVSAFNIQMELITL